MSSTDNRTPGRPARQSDRSNGQWAVDGTEPLNPNEEFKAADNGLNVRQRIIDTYSKNGFASIPADDLNGRMRWWGLYTQRRQGIDGGRTGTVSPEELSDEYFMLRVRLDGGAVTTEQLRVLAGIGVDFARDTADISDRQNIQYHWIRIEDVPKTAQQEQPSPTGRIPERHGSTASAESANRLRGTAQRSPSLPRLPLLANDDRT